jgi:hypothetical protein
MLFVIIGVVVLAAIIGGVLLATDPCGSGICGAAAGKSDSEKDNLDPEVAAVSDKIPAEDLKKLEKMPKEQQRTWLQRNGKKLGIGAAVVVGTAALAGAAWFGVSMYRKRFAYMVGDRTLYACAKHDEDKKHSAYDTHFDDLRVVDFASFAMSNYPQTMQAATTKEEKATKAKKQSECKVAWAQMSSKTEAKSARCMKVKFFAVQDSSGTPLPTDGTHAVNYAGLLADGTKMAGNKIPKDWIGATDKGFTGPGNANVDNGTTKISFAGLAGAGAITREHLSEMCKDTECKNKWGDAEKDKFLGMYKMYPADFDATSQLGVVLGLTAPPASAGKPEEGNPPAGTTYDPWEGKPERAEKKAVDADAAAATPATQGLSKRAARKPWFQDDAVKAAGVAAATGRVLPDGTTTTELEKIWENFHVEIVASKAGFTLDIAKTMLNPTGNFEWLKWDDQGKSVAEDTPWLNGHMNGRPETIAALAENMGTVQIFNKSMKIATAAYKKRVEEAKADLKEDQMSWAITFPYYNGAEVFAEAVWGLPAFKTVTNPNV